MASYETPHQAHDPVRQTEPDYARDSARGSVRNSKPRTALHDKRGLTPYGTLHLALYVPRTYPAWEVRSAPPLKARPVGLVLSFGG